MEQEKAVAQTAEAKAIAFRRAAVRTLFSSIIAILFLLILMVAALQQQAGSHLEDGMSFTTAHAQVSAIEVWTKELEKSTAALEIENKVTRGTLEEPLLKERGALATSNLKVAQLAKLIKDSGSCSVFDSPQPADTTLWGPVYQCWYAGKVGDAVGAEIKALAGSPDDPTQISNRIANYEAALKRAQGGLVAAEAAIKTQQQRLAKAEEIAKNMEDVRVFDRSLLGWLGLTWIPPATMQIVLTFVSGLFGSLLVTLILAVYPNNNLHFTTSDSYWNRILLGGLIAVGVFIVIGGGLAVLSAGKSDPDGSTNFLSFCAIGMMAGMFSDKFAGWISDNAEKLTARRDAADGESPPPPPPPS